MIGKVKIGTSIGLCGIEMVLVDVGQRPEHEPQSDCVELKYLLAAD